MILLTNRDASCRILARGGSLAGWSIGDQFLLREAQAHGAVGPRDPRQLASFPLVPYSNRIAHGRFPWDGKVHQLQRNMPPEPHTIHGVGFQRAWTITGRRDGQLELCLRHAPDADWPFAFEARQTFTLGEATLTVGMTIQNLEDTPAPCAFGHHPYFDAAGASLTFRAQTVWLNDPSGLPAEAMPVSGLFDFSAGGAIHGRRADNCFTGWDGHAVIGWTGRRLAVRITASPTLPALVVYIPEHAEAFCAEPVPHLTDSLNRPSVVPHLAAIAPGATFTSSITFDALPVTGA